MASGAYANAYGVYNEATASYASAFGYGNKVGGEHAIASGYNNNIAGNFGQRFRYGEYGQHIRSAAVGSNNTVSGEISNALAIIIPPAAIILTRSAINNQAQAFAASAIGYQNRATASAVSASAVGRSNEVSNEYANAFRCFEQGVGFFLQRFRRQQ